MTPLPETVKIVEVGPRDGLQNEPEVVATQRKAEFVGLLAEAGLQHIEVTSFVRPQLVPQLADAAELISLLPAADGVEYSALVPNEKGLQRAIEAGVKRIALFTAASETFAQKNIGMSIAESLSVFERVAGRAAQCGVTVRAYISTCFVCPFEGEIAHQDVRPVAERLLAIGADEVSISDTVGAACPADIERMVEHLAERIELDRLALHLHDTYGTALANVWAGLQMGVTTFDASAGGLGGCPFAPGATGNLATEDLVYLLDRSGIACGVDLSKLACASTMMADTLGRPLPSRRLQRYLAQNK